MTKEKDKFILIRYWLTKKKTLWCLVGEYGIHGQWCLKTRWDAKGLGGYGTFFASEYTRDELLILLGMRCPGERVYEERAIGDLFMPGNFVKRKMRNFKRLR